MGVANLPDIFQHKINNLFHGFWLIHASIDDLLILTKGDWTYHLKKLELNINKLKESGLKFNMEKSFFGKIKMEYLGFWVTGDGVKSLDLKTQAIKI